ncbi:MAG: response regulator [Dehalococcoidia bacterium]
MATGAQEPQVLTVEDDERIQRLIETVLRAEGYVVVSAQDGVSALDILDHATPGVILLDLMMPGLDGWELLRRVREKGLEIPVALISAVRDLPEQAEKLGAADSLSKPFDVNELVSEVETYVERSA